MGAALLIAASSVCIAGDRKIAQSADARPQQHSAIFSQDDGLSVIAAALDSRDDGTREDDCSHLVHAIYERAGFHYRYVDSRDLYRGTGSFRRVADPQPGDLVVWKGHVGIVVSPAQRLFFSNLRHGPGVDAYDAQYWKKRGPVRFYRYLKNAPADDANNPE
jgi:cell wall-associated NlpC family hydrolase